MDATVSVNAKQKRGFLSPAAKENIRIYIYKFSRNWLSVLGLVIVLISIICAIFPAQLAPYPKDAGAVTHFKEAKLAPNVAHWFGTDISGRDIFSRCIFAFRNAIEMAILVLGISVPFGVFLGLLAGYYHGKWVDSIIMRIADVFIAIPQLVLALSIASLLKPGMFGSMLALNLVWWTWYTRMVYGLASSVSKEYFVINAELIGASKIHIIFNEILPSILSPVLTKVALDVGWVILTGAALSFAGLGEQPPAPAFGTMVSDGAKYLPEMWWITIFPALCIAFVILGFNLFGDGIRDMLDRGRN